MYNQIGNANPQLMREIKSRFKTSKVLFTLSSSLALQGLVLFFYWTQLPVSIPHNNHYNPYCYPSASYNSFIITSSDQPSRRQCLEDTAGHIIISWTRWWLHISLALSMIAIAVLLIGGLFFLIENLVEEQEKGNLNFIRLSPQPGYKIVLGKLLGVPFLLYLGVAAALPLHSVAATNGGFSLREILLFYTLVAAGIFSIYSLTMLYVMSGGKQPLAFSLLLGGSLSYISFLTLSVLFYLEQIDYYYYDLQSVAVWFNFRFPKSSIYSQAFWTVSFIVFSGLIFNIVSQRYQNPNSTLITKKQGYVLCAILNFYALGFLLDDSGDSQQFMLVSLKESNNYSIFLLLLLIGLVISLSPGRQNLQDWARYRHRLSQLGAQSHYSLWQDLLWGEKSPSILAMAINITLSIATLGIWVLSWNHSLLHEDGDPVLLSIGILILLGWLACYSVLVQCLSFTTTASKHRWVIGLVLILLVIGPHLLLTLFDPRSNDHQGWVLFVFGGSLRLADSPDLLTEALYLLLAQALGIGLMLSLFTYELRQVGQSELKRLMRDSPAQTLKKEAKRG
ncbi:MAG: hypothetical protein HLUCCO16_12265 [Phormidium sp. OSCR]|nr:MAG: hypothetical protein HLUCCO16_12265 [Phormidium sp. OSCR]